MRIDLSNHGSKELKGFMPTRILSAKMQKTKTGKGTMLVMEFAPIEAPKVKVRDRLNIIHENEKAQSIGRNKLGDIVRACELSVEFDTEDTSPLLNNIIDAKYKQNDDGYYEIVAYRKSSHVEESSEGAF